VGGDGSLDVRGPVRVLVWGENEHDQRNPIVQQVYPRTMHEEIAASLRRHFGDAAVVETATFDQPEHGCSIERLTRTDVLLWWGHLLHEELEDTVAQRVCDAVLGGMGLIALHSGHLSKPFRSLMGTTCTLRVRESGDRELVWTVAPGHPIAAGVEHPLVIPLDEMYGEFFDVPPPDDLVFISSFSGGEVVRSGMTWTRGQGRIFYFSPGHETFPVYHHPGVHRVLANAVSWVRSAERRLQDECVESPVGWFEEA
jgi:trehalose utilization protein